MSQTDDSIVDKTLQELEDIARSACEGTPYIVDGSNVIGRFLVSTEAVDTVLLVCQHGGSVIAINVYSPEGTHCLHNRLYVVKEKGLQHPTEEGILLSPKEAWNKAISSFEYRLKSS